MNAPAERVAPASFAQARLWLLDRMFPAESHYNEQQALRFAGTLDVAVLRRAIDAVVARHEALRTRFGVRDGEPVQRIAPSIAVPLEVEDLARVPEAEREAEARRRARADAALPFDLARGPLIRARLLRLHDREHWLLLAAHHIVTDGWSSVVLAREIALLYEAFAADRPSPLPALPIQYADYAIHQRESIAAHALDDSREHWKRALANLPTLELVTDRPRPPVADHRGERVAFAVPAGVLRALKALSRRRRATLFMTLLAALDVLLHRYTGQADIAVGVPVAGRTRPELASLIGFFVNMVVMRADLSGDPPFVALLDRVRDFALESYEHQALPFERIVMELAPSRDPSRNPLFQVSFALHQAPSSGWELPGLRIEPLEGLAGVGAKFDLGFTLTEDATGMHGTVDYATALFDRESVEAMVASFTALLASIASDPRQRIQGLALEAPDARARRVAQGRATRFARPESVRIERWFERRAAARPDAIAIDGGRGSVSYRELDARANRLARALRGTGLPPSRRIGIALDRGADLVVAMLAVLKAGAAYVPLDPEHPVERLAAILDDASIDLVVTEERWLARFPGRERATLCVDRDAARIASHDDAPLEADADAGDIACVMHTSGSTGRPKAVPVPHAALVNLVVDADYVTLGHGDAIAMLANPAFDAASFEIHGALANGARLVPIAKADVLEPRLLAATLVAKRVTTIFVTTALFNAIAREAPAAFHGCRQVLFGGEAVEPRRVCEVLRAGAPARLVHVYGPTETTTFATWHDVTAADAERATIPIGRPIAGAEAYVLDAAGVLAPPGMPGEIHIGGAGLARGYLGDQVLTDERFVPDPFSVDPTARLFRTGDRARTRGDGAIEFLGRTDRQVKLRGQRIELDEIQGALVRLPTVREAVVELRGATSDTRRIVAWLVPADATAPPPTTLRRDLRRTLPEVMLPGAIVWVPALPLTANGKVDARALPDPGETAGTGPAAPPRDMFEGVLVRIWEELLGIRGIGVHDHFFEIGGHSLLAARLVDAIERETGFALPLTTLFVDDTIDGVARTLREGSPEGDHPIVAVHQQGRRAPFVFLHGDFQAGGYYSRALARALGPDQPTLIVHPHGLAGEAVPATIEAMAADRVRALRAIRPDGPYVVGGHCNGALVAFEMARQLIADGAAVPAVVLIESRAPSPGGRASATGGAYIKFNAAGEPRVLAPHDRLSEIELAFTRAIDAYAGGRCDAHVVVVQAQEWRDSAADAGWARFARSWEGHVVPGDHVTMITRHLADLARTIHDAILRAVTVA